jgi:hypothetical protein
MKKNIFILGSIIAIAILLYPQSIIGKLTGSPGGKTGSPMDNSDCTSCHSVVSTDISTTHIVSNIPSTGYVPGNTYTITSNLNSFDESGFEITCEENTNSTKTGIFFNTNASETQLVNNGNSITHTAAGSSSSTWSFDWEAPTIGTGDITFYGAFITAGYPIGSNSGDFLTLSTLSVSESSTTDITETSNYHFKEILKITDILGKETKAIKNEPLFYIYGDGTVEKKIIIE